MPTRTLTQAGAIAVFALLISEATASNDWRQWRGPGGAGVAEGSSPPLEWGDDNNISWKVAIPGKGSGTPIVLGDRVFITSAIETDRPDENAPPEEEGDDEGGGNRWSTAIPKVYYQFVVYCLDRATGEIVWQTVATEQVPHEGLHPTNNYASASPTTDGERLYVSFGSYGIYCFDLEGNPLWDLDLGDMRTAASFGEGASPTLAGDALIVPWDHQDQSFIVVLDAATGAERWKADRDEGTTWTTPLVTQAAGKTQVIMNGSNRVRSYDLATGELIWECGGQVSNPIPHPIRYGDDVCCMSGHRGAASRMIRLDSLGDVTDDEDQIVWSHDKGTPYVPSPLLYGDRLYFCKGNKGILTILRAVDGEPLVDQKRLPDIENVYASPVGADGRVYFTDRDGTTLVLKDSDQMEVLATNELGEGVDASPAIAGDALFIRAEGHVYRISEQ